MFYDIISILVTITFFPFFLLCFVLYIFRIEKLRDVLFGMGRGECDGYGWNVKENQYPNDVMYGKAFMAKSNFVFVKVLRTTETHMQRLKIYRP